MDKKKKIIVIICSIIIAIMSLGLISYVVYELEFNKTHNQSQNKLKELPPPEVTGGARGELGIDKNINESTIDEYLNREDSVYRDMRMLEDPANYEAIGGDRYLSGYIKGFEIVPLPYIIPVTGLPAEVGDTYMGQTLFYEEDGVYIANYEESMSIVEELFPKDKVLFLMCGGGGYAGLMKKFLVTMGWDENKIYNIGGYWYYEGNNKVTLKNDINGNIVYDFSDIPYHEIKFYELTASNNYREPDVKVKELKLSAYKIELEQYYSFQLDPIVLPNEASGYEIEWTSSNKSVASVSTNGLVRGEGEGKATITARTSDGAHSVSCEVTVTKQELDRLVLDDVSEEAKAYDEIDLDGPDKEFNSLVNLPDGGCNEEYYDISSDGGCTPNDKWHEAYDTYMEKETALRAQKVEIFNKLLDDNKTFIVVIDAKECGVRTYSVYEAAQKILDDNNYSYIKIGNGMVYDNTLEESKLDHNNLYSGSLSIIKDGKIYTSIDLNTLSIKNDAELKSWLNKYIEID